MIYFNNRTGLLMVRATLDDLEIIQRAIETLNHEPPQVDLEARAVRLTDADVREIGFDWVVNPMAAAGATATSIVAGVLTEPQFKVVLKALEQRSLLATNSLQRITTLSGRQTQIRMTNLPTVDPQQASATPWNSEQIVDVIPYVSADDFTIQMSLMPTLLQFLEDESPTTIYDPQPTPRSPVEPPPLTTFRNGTPTINASTPLPRYRLRQVVTNVKVWDGQTIALCYPTMLAGDRLAPKRQEEVEPKHVVVFITPTIIDPAGNAVHSLEQMPFAREAVPSQPAAK